MQTKTILVSKETWMKLHHIKRSQDKKSLAEVVDCLIEKKEKELV